MSDLMTRYEKILIANRGEIAVRVIRACQELGLSTVAVYSDVDRNAMHVRFSDEAYHIGPPSAQESYLVIEKIIDAALRSGADAIHPGYGFLAEKAVFAQACMDAGITFIGPSPDAIEAMGDKITARQLMDEAGVPLVPGTPSDARLSDEDLVQAAEQVGYPLLIKAAAGGGGKGMRRVHSREELEPAIAAARRESAAAFNDDAVYLEKLIENARHIEIQIIADSHGNVIHLGERECSIQRRHQKIVEEAPSPVLTEELRQQMGEVAVQAARAVNYSNAGTVEFLLDKDNNFYFIEMNTRLQVEHPITELVTNMDIVKEQIRVSRGRKLSRTQEQIQIKGVAIECRINAEDPYNNFLPSIGTITSLDLPSGPGVRVDTGITSGNAITPYYDPMIAKLICWGETRAEAILRMRRALNEYRIMGLRTNIPFHQALMNSTRYQAGQYDTMFVEQRFSLDVSEEDAGRLQPEIAAIIATIVANKRRQQAGQIVGRNERDVSNWKLMGRWEGIRRF